MLKDVVFVSPRKGYRLFVRFEDGVEGEIDVRSLVEFKGVFSELNDEAKFNLARVNPELGSVEWNCGADLDPDVIYSVLAKQPIPAYGAVKQP